MVDKDQCTQSADVSSIDMDADNKEEMDVEHSEVQAKAEDSSFALLTQAEKEKVINNVVIKKEVLEEEAVGLTASCPDETSASDTRMGSVSDNDWDDSASDTDMSDSDNPERPPDDKHINSIEQKSLDVVSTVKRNPSCTKVLLHKRNYT